MTSVGSWNWFQHEYKTHNPPGTKEQISKAYKKYKQTQKSPNLRKIKESLPATRVAKRKSIERLKPISEGRGSPSRGWAGMSPQKGKERHELHQKCGDKAFLQPKQEGYPVMPALRITKGKCEYSCHGIQTAYNRSRQYNLPAVADKAERLGKKHCGW